MSDDSSSATVPASTVDDLQGTPFEPTEEQRRTVRAMAGFGVPHDDIAALLDVEPEILRQHLGRELNRGSIEATAKVAQTLFHMATVDKNVSAAIFWMKARAGWREKTSIEQLGPDGLPIAPPTSYTLTLERILDRIADGQADAPPLIGSSSPKDR